MKGSIRFDNEINVEVEVDPSQDEGARLLSAVNLADGQELSGGSNPNSVRVIEGTLDNPWGSDLVISDFFTALSNGDANAFLTVDATGLGAQIVTVPLFKIAPEIPYYLALYFEEGIIANTIRGLWVQYNSAGELTRSSVMAGEDGAYTATYITDTASQIPTTLTIYWHPMPEAVE